LDETFLLGFTWVLMRDSREKAPTKGEKFRPCHPWFFNHREFLSFTSYIIILSSIFYHTRRTLQSHQTKASNQYVIILEREGKLQQKLFKTIYKIQLHLIKNQSN
jgi:hypothetical protein